MDQRVMKLNVEGCREAELFTREIQESVEAVLAKNYVSKSKDGELGFVSVSVDGRCWTDTMWTRDAGVFIREMAFCGYFDKGIETVRCLLRHVARNGNGHKMFPDHFRPGQPPCAGTELDGTCAILIGMILLWERLPSDHQGRREIEDFIMGVDSPVKGLFASLEKHGLVSGSGEFGGGWDNPGEFFNVVQNNLVRLTLLAVSRFASARKNTEFAEKCTTAAKRILDEMMSKLRYPDGTWLWCRRSPSFAIDWDVLNCEKNDGFGGINGVLSMSADVLGLLTDKLEDNWLYTCERTFMQLLGRPIRLKQFADYGFWPQFDKFRKGFLTSGYGYGYAIQCMQLMDLPDFYTPAINWFARTTYEPLPDYVLHRDSKYWIYEGYYSPEAAGKIELPEGCGPLNLVSVMEPLKIARMILGVDDHDPAHILIIPRLPLGWTHLEAHNVPVLTTSGVVYVDIEIIGSDTGCVQQVSIKADRAISRLNVRLGTARDPKWQSRENIKNAVFNAR